uniref:Metallo-beta-lactamase domain-containing protein 1 n=1 Tax=Elaeophora elaphi TaxID=1147741 RepID=A0A0R3RJP1_9BILA
MMLSETDVATSEIRASENPMIYIIREGSVAHNNENDYEFVSSITLVIDGSERILVDTGLSTDINGRTWIMQRLSELGAPPPSINHVITTHGHPDHSGNTNYFPDASHYAGRFMHIGSNFSRIFQDDIEKLTKNVYLLKTPGHTSDDISVFINNTSFFGTVVISGDIFIRKEDMKDSTMWKQLAANETQQEESRRRLLCLADCIVPGHGPLFRITSNMKRELNCLSSY